MTDGRRSVCRCFQRFCRGAMPRSGCTFMRRMRYRSCVHGAVLYGKIGQQLPRPPVAYPFVPRAGSAAVFLALRLWPWVDSGGGHHEKHAEKHAEKDPCCRHDANRTASRLPSAAGSRALVRAALPPLPSHVSHSSSFSWVLPPKEISSLPFSPPSNSTLLAPPKPGNGDGAADRVPH